MSIEDNYVDKEPSYVADPPLVPLSEGTLPRVGIGRDALSEGLDRLRSLDRLVDISKSTIQIDILLALNKKEMSISEIANNIGQRRKATTDALRKLRNKGLIDISREDGKGTTYMLSESGVRCNHLLLSFMGSPTSEEHVPSNSKNKEECLPSDGGPTRSERQVIQIQPKICASVGQGNFAVAVTVSEIIFALGTANENTMPLRKLAKMIELSEQRAESYLKLYLHGEPKLFRRFVSEPGWVKVLTGMGIRVDARPEPAYGLTNEGLQYFYKMPIYARLRDSASYRLLSKITMTNNPRGMLKRLMFFASVGGVASACLAFGIILTGIAFMPFGLAVAGLWLFFMAFVGMVTATSPML